jgi:hypothetical protein
VADGQGIPRSTNRRTYPASNADNGPGDPSPPMTSLLAIDQLRAEWMSSNGQAGKAAAGESVSRGRETRRPI